MTIEDIMNGALPMINQFLKEEIIAQGHTLTGAYENSFEGSVKTDKDETVLTGDAIPYWKYVDFGFPKESASMRQYPFILAYFIQRGFPIKGAQGEISAGQMAAATIRKWMRQKGMSTIESRAYSKTGARQHAIEDAFRVNNGRLDEYMGNSFDFAIEELFQKEKSERI
jgi:hypothetical protein